MVEIALSPNPSELMDLGIAHRLLTSQKEMPRHDVLPRDKEKKIVPPKEYQL